MKRQYRFLIAGALCALWLGTALRAAGQWTTATLSQARWGLSATSAGGKVFFAGGYASNSYSAVVDIYDTANNQWSIATLSQAQSYLSATSAGGKVFFAGGSTGSGIFSVVDIYDTATNQWTTANLSQARASLSATSAGGKVFFAGGVTNGGASNVVDIYDTATNQWTTAILSQARYRLSATSAGGKVFFAGGDTYGGVSNVVDIYDTATNQWTTANLSQARYSLSATSVGGKVFFAGGFTGSGNIAVVDIYDTATNQWTTANLSQARSSLSATSAGDKVFFAGGSANSASNMVDIYSNAQTPTLTQQPTPASQTICQGGPASSTVAATGDNLSYQWYKNQPDTDEPVSGQTGATLTLSNLQPADGGSYYCRVSGDGGAVWSEAFVLTVNPAATASAITLGDDGQVCQATPSQSSTIAVQANFGGGATHGSFSDGGVGGTFSVVKDGTLIAGNYYPPVNYVGPVTITFTTNDPDGPCPAASSTANVTVNQAATASAITAGDNTICQNGTTTFTASWGGSATYGGFTDGGIGGTFTYVSLVGNQITYSYKPPLDFTGDITMYFVTTNPPGPCSYATTTTTLTVNPAATASAITAGASSICKNGTTTFKAAWGGAATYGGFTDGGIGGTFSFVSLVGTEITYSYTPPLNFTGDITMYFVTTDPPGVCSYATTTTTLTVNPPPVVSITGLASSYCQNASAFALTGSPAGGTFKVDGTPATQLTPAALSVGSHLVEYTYTDGNGCTNSTSQSVEIINPVFASGATVSGPACAGQTLTLSFGMSCTGSATFTAQLSDKDGSFAAPTATWPVVPGANVLPLPTHLPTGEGYRLRVLQSAPALISEQSASFKITALMVALYPATPGKLCQGDDLPVTFSTLGNCPYPAGNVFTVQLSNATGSFANPRVLGTASPGTTTFPASTLAGLPVGTGYRVRILSSNQAQTSQASLPFKLEGPSLAVTPGVSGAPVCRGSAVTLNFSLPTGSCAFPNDNVFTAQLSNATGGFGSPTNLGPVQPGVSNSLTIPANTPAGTGYRVRVVSSSPALTSQNSSPFRVNACTNRMSAPDFSGPELIVSPNPVNTGREIHLRVTGLDNPTFCLLTGAGQRLAVDVRPGDEVGTFAIKPAQTLPPGVYLVQASEGTLHLTRRVVMAE